MQVKHGVELLKVAGSHQHAKRYLTEFEKTRQRERELPGMLATHVLLADQTSPAIVETSSLTASTLFWNATFSVSFSSSSTIFSTPPVPRMAGTPT